MPDRLSIRQHPLYKIFIWVALVASLALLWQMNARILSNPKYIPVDDFSHYWAAGRLNANGQDPYDPQLIQNERDALLTTPTEYDTVPIMWTPPWSLAFVMPFGLLDYPLSRLLWLVANVSVLLLCANLLWKVYAGLPKKLFWAWVITFTFGPTISILEKGQITPVVLLGIVLFLSLVTRPYNNLAMGLAVLMTAVKPQIIYLFWPALLFWIIRYKRWRLLLGAGIVVFAVTGFAWVLNPGVISDYLYALRTITPTDWATPTIGGYLRLAFGIEQFWLQFIPPIFGLAWFIVFLRRNNWELDWLTAAPPILLVSILTAPYAWTYDHVVLIPAMIFAWISLTKIRETRARLFFGTALFIISLLDLWLHRYFGEFWFIWLAPAWVIWYYSLHKYTILHSTRQVNEYAA